MTRNKWEQKLKVRGIQERDRRIKGGTQGPLRDEGQTPNCPELSSMPNQKSAEGPVFVRYP